jgi:hypothetical protein
MIVLLVWQCTCHEVFLVWVLLRRVCPIYLVFLNVYTLNNCGPGNFSSSVLWKHVHLILLNQSWFLARLMHPYLCLERRVLWLSHYWTLQIYLGKLSMRFICISLRMKRSMSFASLNWARFNFKVSNWLMRICNSLLDCLVEHMPFIVYYFFFPTVSILLRLSESRID